MIEKALSQYGVTEMQGAVANNPDIINYFASIGQIWVKTDETAWCSAFINWVAKETEHEYTGKLNARSWLDVGERIPIPKLGDIVILWRISPNDWRGHVGFYINSDDRYIWVLGGNQGNQVCIKPYPVGRLLGYRRLRKL